MKRYKNKGWLYRKHWIERCSTYEMARLADCTPPTIKNWMNRYKIATRTRSEAQINLNKKGGESPMLGKHHTKETKKKISKANLGRHRTEETKKKMRDAKILWHKAHPGMRKGKNSSNWKGGKTIVAKGYILIHAPDHPHAQKGGYVFEHRLIIEETLGRYLLPEEIVHHEDEIKDNNEPENLRLFPSVEKHLAYHRDLRKSAEACL